MFDLAEQYGLEAIKRGWPDFSIFVRSGKFVCVEVKPKDYHSLKYDQFSVMKALAGYGVPCYKWSPKHGFVQIHADGTSTRRHDWEVFNQ